MDRNVLWRRLRVVSTPLFVRIVVRQRSETMEDYPHLHPHPHYHQDTPFNTHSIFAKVFVHLHFSHQLPILADPASAAVLDSVLRLSPTRLHHHQVLILNHLHLHLHLHLPSPISISISISIAPYGTHHSRSVGADGLRSAIAARSATTAYCPDMVQS